MISRDVEFDEEEAWNWMVNEDEKCHNLIFDHFILIIIIILFIEKDKKIMKQNNNDEKKTSKM
jgi:hypothetical protein